MRQLTGFLAAISILLVLFINLFGCAGRPQTIQPVAEKIPLKEKIEIKKQLITPPDRDGSLYQADGFFNDLFVDTKARKVGDIVTIKIEESAKATNKADTKTGRDSSLKAGIDTLFGLEDWYQDHMLNWYSSKRPKINPFGNPSVKGSLKSDFGGSGSTSRSGDLKAFITSRVTEVMPNGNLKIVGSREVMVNHETQLIIISGVIRPRDISEDNIILSTFISNARIAYSGTGIINDRQRPGWLANLLNTIWPF